MKIIKTKSIEPENISNYNDSQFESFNNRPKIHSGIIPNFFVYIKDYAWNAFLKHGENIYATEKHEAQGIILGKYFIDEHGSFVVGTQYEEGTGKSTRSFVDMTEECLLKISDKCQKENLLMLVWLHTHPGFGTGYSKVDIDCLTTNFYKEFQTGIVADILQDKSSGYKVISNNVEKFNDYAIFDNELTLSLPFLNKQKKIIGNPKEKYLKILSPQSCQPTQSIDDDLSQSFSSGQSIATKHSNDSRQRIASNKILTHENLQSLYVKKNPKIIKPEKFSDNQNSLFTIFKNRKNYHSDIIPNFFVYINESVWKDFLKNGKKACDTNEKKSQGVILGKYFDDEYGSFVVGTHYEEANGVLTNSHVSIYGDCMKRIHAKCMKENLLILIWLRTHFDNSILFSTPDIHFFKSNFYQNFQTGLSVDMLRKKIKGYKTKMFLDEYGIDSFNNFAIVDNILLQISAPFFDSIDNNVTGSQILSEQS